MKQIRIPHGALCVLLGALAFGVCVAGYCQITGSAHDFSYLNPEQKLCISCHTPHGADTSAVQAPLWNREIPSRTYFVYSSPSLDATMDQPSAASKLCLSCHDGSLAVDLYGGNIGTRYIRDSEAIAGDFDELRSDHPISFLYDDALAAEDGELYPPTTTSSGLGRTIQLDLLIEDQLECSSCHDVHNGPAAVAVDDNLLVITQRESRLCLTCHNK